MHPNKDPAPATPSGHRVAVIGSIFLLLATAIVAYYQAFLIPVFLGLYTAAKALLKTFTPKVLLLFAKNSLVIKLRQTVVRSSAQWLFLSHKPVRQRLRSAKSTAAALLISLAKSYFELPLWIKTALALSVFALTAGSSYAFIALLIIPEPLLRWIKNKVLDFLNKLGVTKGLNTIYRFTVPPQLQHRWAIYLKWTIGRQQVRTARLLRDRAAQSRVIKKLARNDNTE